MLNIHFYKLFSDFRSKWFLNVMKNLQKFLTLVTLLCNFQLNAQNLQPYILGIESNKNVNELKSELKSNLESEGIDVLGEYAPANDENRWLMVISSGELTSAVIATKGLTGFAAVLRIALTVEESKVLITYTNPKYWGNAYFRNDFPEVEKYYKGLTSKLVAAMKKSGQYKGTEFGSKKGIEVEDLRKYRYMFGMPRFDDPVTLNEFNSYEAAISKIEGNIREGKENVSLVYSQEIPNEKMKLYGFALNGEKGESSFLPKIDITNPKHTAFLPYEILVKEGNVYMLHGRYRIALSFPDLTMGTFTKIMSTPGDIKDQFKAITE